MEQNEQKSLDCIFQKYFFNFKNCYLHFFGFYEFVTNFYILKKYSVLFLKPFNLEFFQLFCGPAFIHSNILQFHIFKMF